MPLTVPVTPNLVAATFSAEMLSINHRLGIRFSSYNRPPPNNIIDSWEFNLGFSQALEAGFSALYPFSNLHVKGKGIIGNIQIKVNRTQVKVSDGTIVHGNWLSVHTARFVVSKEIYDNLLRFSKQIHCATWKQRTDFKWQEKGLPLGVVGKASLNKGNVFLLFESKIFGIFGKNDIVFGREDIY